MPEKPPLGLTPERIWLEHRVQAIDDAILRYMHATKPIPENWNRERTRHIERIKEIQDGRN